MEMLATSRVPQEASRGLDDGGREYWLPQMAERPYASPAVSNIAASMASGVLLPAHTTNWNAGK